MKKYVIPIIFLGNNKTGKTTFSNVLQTNMDNYNNYSETIGVNYFRRTLFLDGNEYKLMLWDLTGSHRFIPIIESYLKTAKLIFLFFSYKDEKSVDDLKIWKSLIDKKEEGNFNVFLIGSWLDVKDDDRCINLDKLNNICKELGYNLYEVNSQSIESVLSVIKKIIRNMDIELKEKTYEITNNVNRREYTCLFDCFGF